MKLLRCLRSSYGITNKVVTLQATTKVYTVVFVDFQTDTTWRLTRSSSRVYWAMEAAPRRRSGSVDDDFDPVNAIATTTASYEDIGNRDVGEEAEGDDLPETASLRRSILPGISFYLFAGSTV